MAGEVVPLQREHPLAAIVGLSNCADRIDEAELGRIGDLAVREYELDRESMADWRSRMDRGVKLATLVKDTKSYPFEGAANVKYPLVTTAALQFNAKAYPAIVKDGEMVRTRVWGSDPNGQKAARGERVSAHMSWQLSCQIEEWEEGVDKLLTQLPIVGTMVKKVWYDTAQSRIRARVVPAGKFVLNDRVATLGDAPRCSEEIEFYPDEITERVTDGTWLNIDYRDAEGEDTAAPEAFIEQHRRIDLDDDGYGEPYIVTVHVKSRKVARIVADFDMGDVSFQKVTIPAPEGMKRVDSQKVAAIRRGSYFIPYHFLPSLDGGFWSTGLGLLLGDISETINSIINQMLDAGHMASLGGGFIGSEFRIKGGSQRFKPGEWKMVSATGGTVRDSLVELTWPGPNQTLFELLGLLIEAAKDIASVKDVLMGEAPGGKAQTATTTLALIEQGMAQFTAAYKRIFRSLKQEFRLIAKINAGTVTPDEYNRFHDLMGEPQQGPNGEEIPGEPIFLDPRQEYDMSDMDIVPVADPASVTRMQEAAKAQVLMEMAQAQNPLVALPKASERILEAAAIPDVDELLPQPDPMAQQMAMLQAQLLEAQVANEQSQPMLNQAKAQSEQQRMVMDAQAAERTSAIEQQKMALDGQKMQGDAAKSLADARKSEREALAKVRELEIKAQEAADNSRKTDAEIAKLYAEIEAMRADRQRAAVETDLKAREVAFGERKGEAEIERGRAEIARGSRQDDIAERKLAVDARKHERDAALAERKTDGELKIGEAKVASEHARGSRQIDVSEDKNKSDAKLAEAKNKADARVAAKAAGVEEKPRKTRTRVTKHDDKGRILEFEQEAVEE